MNRILLLTATLFACLYVQADQITKEEADNIVLERMSPETRQYTIYAKDGVQQKMTITSVDGEVLDVNYKFWCYYIEYIDNTGKYIILKESNGNLLEVNVKGDAKPEDLEEWRIVEAMQISLVNTKWKLIGFVDTQTGVLTEPEPVNSCERCYTIAFTDDTVPELGTFLIGTGCINTLAGTYEIDYTTNNINLLVWQATDAGELFDEKLYMDSLNSVYYYSLANGTTYPRILQLYYNDGKNYLKHKEIGGDINGD